MGRLVLLLSPRCERVRRFGGKIETIRRRHSQRSFKPIRSSRLRHSLRVDINVLAIVNDEPVWRLLPQPPIGGPGAVAGRRRLPDFVETPAQLLRD